MIANVTGPVCYTPSCNSPSSFYITTTPSSSSFYITTTPSSSSFYVTTTPSSSSFYVTTTPSPSSFYVTATPHCLPSTSQSPPHHLPSTSQPPSHYPHGDAQVRTTIAVCVLCVYACVISFSSAINNIFYGSRPAYICAGSGAGCAHGDVNIICKIACVMLIAPYHHCCYHQYSHQYCNPHCHHYSSGESMPLC